MLLIDVDAFREDYGLAERCENCPRYGKKDCDYPYYSARDFCGWLDDAPTIVGWISVKVAKPTPIHRECDRNEHPPVLLYARKDDSIYVGWYVGEDYRGIDCYISRTSMSSYQHITKKITYWMPRPKTPEG